MEETTNQSQEPTQTSTQEGGNMGKLENELEEIKRRAETENPFNKMTASQTSSGQGGGLIKFGLILFALSVVLAGIYIVKSLIGKVSLPKIKNNQNILITTSPSSTANPFTGWNKYRDSSGTYSFSYPTDYSTSDYKEDGNLGVLVSKNEGFGAQYGKDYVKIKALYLKGQNLDAKTKLNQLRTLANSLQKEKGRVSEVSEIKVGERQAYKYQITSSSDITAEDVVLQAGRDLVRIEIEYQFVEPKANKYEDSIGKILSSFTFTGQPAVSTSSSVSSSLPNTGIFSTTEPEGSTESSSFGEITQ